MDTYFPHRVEESEDTRTYYNEKGDEIVWFLMDGGKMAQVQIFLSDRDPQVENKMLRWNNGYYSSRIWEIHYERVFRRENVEVRQFYSNDELWMYTETIDSGNWRFRHNYSAEGQVFCIEIDLHMLDGEYQNLYSMMREETGWRVNKSLVEDGFRDWNEIF